MNVNAKNSMTYLKNKRSYIRSFFFFTFHSVFKCNGRHAQFNMAGNTSARVILFLLRMKRTVKPELKVTASALLVHII